MKIRIYLLFIVLIASQLAQAQYTPYFENFSFSQYDAGNQNWGVSKAENGKVYVANNNGLLVYNGLNWKLNALPNKTTIRSVLVVKDKIYTGSYEEFGYWQYNNKGELIYHSLSHLINRNKSLNEEFWQILQHDNKIIFRSFLNVYVLDNNTITKIESTDTIISCSVSNNTVYVNTLTNGIFTLKDNTLTPFLFSDDLVDAKIIGIANYQNSLLITTALKGSFTLINNNLQPTKLPINDIIKKHQLNSFLKLENGNMVFGTIKNGIYVTNNLGQVIFNINKENGLVNNTVLNIIADNDANIWVCLDNGLSKINLKNNITYYNDVSGKLGAVYDVIKYNDTIYIGSNTGLYYLNNQHQLIFIEGSQGQVWDLKLIDNQLFCGHNDGTFLVKNNTIQLISNFTGGWTIKKIPDNNSYVQGTYGGLVKFNKTEESWAASYLGQPTIPIKYLEFEDKNNIWAAHAYKGLIKVKLNNTFDSIIDYKEYNTKATASDYNIKVYKIKNNICFKTNDGWKTYEPLADSIIPYKFLNDKIGPQSDVVSEDLTNNLFFKNNKGIIQLKATNNDKLVLTRDYYDDRLIVGYENISQINDSIYALNLNNGFLLLNANQNFTVKKPVKPLIEKIQVNDIRVKIDTSVIELPNNGKLSISIASPNSNNHFFEYSLSTNPTKWDKVDNENLVLSNIKNGDFSILFRTSNKAGETSPVKTINLHVLPPWYKSSTGFIIYALALILALGIMYLLHKRKMKKEQKLLEIEFKKEQQQILKEKNIENDRKIIKLKNESLQNEIKLKSKQLANTAIALVKKNEALLEIKKELQINEGQFQNKQVSKRLQKKIDHTIGHKDEWEIFEYNFNQVHEKFFNQLKIKHPKLSHKDLKLCAYIKMNLVTKEIAPLMNISTRGIETHRYRLKRKLNLSSEDSLTDYLNSFI
ncbi:LuxR C-terminal-related transcriptional regulator [Olleya sp. Hel_I_94]|uniref:helix-turn-helix and ligand-binding sensor domain-containing protein n=1 Tax=Olleya sp. Hel_I_94 TaxID=1250001 RepID=UPI0011A80C43|nr:LuxR C-terminal-related transcriptional regulator [Olleya sp. Hel_I_94]TVZ47954.1 regulatory LuxR family protein [Olleya sp. Hel_I_94]